MCGRILTGFSCLLCLSAKRLGPIAAQNFPFDVSYGYHFDAHLVGGVLRDHALIFGRGASGTACREVDAGENGNVARLLTNDGETDRRRFLHRLQRVSRQHHSRGFG